MAAFVRGLIFATPLATVASLLYYQLHPMPWYFSGSVHYSHGWPFPFCRAERGGEFYPWRFALDLAVLFVLSASVLIVVAWCLRRGFQLRFSTAIHVLSASIMTFAAMRLSPEPIVPPSEPLLIKAPVVLAIGCAILCSIFVLTRSVRMIRPGRSGSGKTPGVTESGNRSRRGGSVS